jgi:hypothetical protein
MKIAPIKFNTAFFRDALCVHGSDSYRPTPDEDIVDRFANGRLVRDPQK